jgi:sterol desaturase/sphingolipid hydroxylase (fatty acid hydroxylase superfamily)
MTLDEFLSKVALYLLGPFASWATFLHAISGTVRSFYDLEGKTAWPYLISSALVAYGVYRWARRTGLIDPSASFREFAFPGHVYRHRSAVVDYKFVLVDMTIRLVLYAPFISGLSQLIYRTVSPLGAVLVVELPFSSHLSRSIALTLLAILTADFGFFFAHYLMHRIPVLWRFHEVHHSAEVLTPVTVYRVHPVEEAVNGVVAAVVSALTIVTYTSISGNAVQPLTIYGVNVVVMVFLLVAFQLRHSHIWLSYGPVLSRIFISPAQHQIHHSVDPRHWDKNYGFTFALWDLAFGSLYVPRSRETIRYGVPGADPRDFDTVAKLYFLPFAKAGRVLVGRRGRGGAPDSRAVPRSAGGNRPRAL